MNTIIDRATGFVPSLIRTYVPVGISLLAGWLATRWGIVVDDETQAAGVLAFSGLLLAVYYAGVRWLEPRVPAIGWLLGLAKQPAYSPAPAPAAEPIVISSTDPHELASISGLTLAPQVADELVRLRGLAEAHGSGTEPVQLSATVDDAGAVEVEKATAAPVKKAAPRKRAPAKKAATKKASPSG